MTETCLTSRTVEIILIALVVIPSLYLLTIQMKTGLFSVVQASKKQIYMKFQTGAVVSVQIHEDFFSYREIIVRRRFIVILI